MGKEYKYPKTKKLINQLKKYYTVLRLIEDEYFESIKELEEKITKETGIKDIEIIISEDGIIGIGNAHRTMELVHIEELEQDDWLAKATNNQLKLNPEE